MRALARGFPEAELKIAPAKVEAGVSERETQGGVVAAEKIEGGLIVERKREPRLAIVAERQAPFDRSERRRIEAKVELAGVVEPLREDRRELLHRSRRRARRRGGFQRRCFEARGAIAEGGRARDRRR